MFRKTFVLTTILSVLVVCDAWAAQINSTWVGGWGDWGVASNWNPATVPNNGSNTFAVTIDGSTESVGVGLYNDFTINSLTTYGDVEIQKWILEPMWGLTVINGLTNYGDDVEIRVWIHGNIINNAGQLQIGADISGNVTNNSGATLDIYEHVNIYGDLINNTNGTMHFSETDIDVEGDGDGGKIVNNGLIQCFDNGGPGEDALFENNGQIQLYGGGANGAIFDNNSTGTIKGWGCVTGDQLQNKGTIEASMGTLLLFGDSLTNTGTLKNDAGATLNIHSSVDANNNGTIETNNAGAVTFDCNLINKPAAVIKLYGGILAATKVTQSAGATLEGFGGITGNVIINSSGLIKLTGPTNIVGNVTIQTGATLEINDGQTLVTGLTTNNGTVHVKGGRFVPQGGLTGTGNIIWEAGSPYNNMADFNLDGKVDFGDFAVFADTWLWQAASI